MSPIIRRYLLHCLFTLPNEWNIVSSLNFVKIFQLPSRSACFHKTLVLYICNLVLMLEVAEVYKVFLVVLK